VKIAAGIAAVLAVVCAAGLGARVTGSSAAVESRNMLVVSTTADVANGSVSSLSALRAKPGRDGISLREALMAANKTRGAATVYILFSARLNRKTIKLRSELPPILRDHLVLEGVAPSGAPARVTLDGLRVPLGTRAGASLLVQGSEVTVRWLRFTGVRPKQHNYPAVLVEPGLDSFTHSRGPRHIANVQIVDDVFDNRGIDFPLTHVAAASGVATALNRNTQISGLTIARNAFLHYVIDGDAVGVLAQGAHSAVQGVVIQDNTFDQNAIPIEIGAGGDTERLTGTRIIGNTITGRTTIAGAAGGINLDTDAVNGTIDQTLIENNALSGLLGPITINAAAAIANDPFQPAGDLISNTRIVNNVIRAASGGIYLEGGNTTSSPPSRVSGVTIENDTFVNDQSGTMFAALPNGPGASGNQITDVSIRNSIFSEPSGNPIYVSPGPIVNQAPDVVMNSLISGPGWAGKNGNINGNPQFVDQPNGNDHLAAGSPAINAGTSIGAPTDDFDGARRDARPDIGAFEYGATPRPLLTVTAEQLGGSGTLTSSPAGINCQTACSARFDPNTTVTLRAKPDRASRFLGWQHGCSGKARCTIRLNSAKSITARFAP
jgi:Divergent InlB B-repeat domain